jgi:hypothetical protein
MSARAPIELATDASFRPYFEQNLSSCAALLEVHEASLPDDDSAVLADEEGVATADRSVPAFHANMIDGDVAIVFVDGAKSWEAFVALLGELGAGFRPGQTLVVCQDFQHWLAYWVPMAIGWLLRENAVELVHVLPYNTVSVRVTEGFSPAMVGSMPTTIDALSAQAGMDLLAITRDSLLDAGESEAAAIADLAGVALLGTKGQWLAAAGQLRRAEPRWPWWSVSVAQVDSARAWLRRHAGSAPPRRLRTYAISGALRVRQALVRRLSLRRAAVKA